jgi:spore coat polysaccharide biosynthesis protein SpsF
MPSAAMKVIAIVQARMASTRLPGKVLANLGSHSVLACVIHRVRKCRLIDELVIATTGEPCDDEIVREAERHATPVYRGSEHDVLDRYYQAADTFHAESVVRVTSDCPLIDSEVSDRTIREFLEKRPDYASNVLERTYPRGLDTEVVSMAALEQAWREASQPYERSHVTPYLWQNPQRFRLLSVKGDLDHSAYRWTLDTPEDLSFLRTVYDRFDGSIDFTWRDVLSLLEREPAIAGGNCHIQQKAIEEG